MIKIKKSGCARTGRSTNMGLADLGCGLFYHFYFCIFKTKNINAEDNQGVACTINIVTVVNYAAIGVIWDRSTVYQYN